MAKILTAKDLFAPAFVKVWNDIYYKRKSKICCAGGRGSTKSSFLGYALFLVLEMDRRIALQHKKAGDPKWTSYLTHAVVYRKTFSVCETSVYAQLQWCADKLGLTRYYKFMKSPLKIVRVGTGQTILFRGLDDPMKSRSIKFPRGYPKILWYEEASEFDGIEEINDVTRSVQRGGHDFLTFYSYNPPETSSNWVNYVMSDLNDHDPMFGLYKSDYRTVPREWLGEQFFHDADILRRINERAYRHVYLGEITGNGGTVFPNVQKVKLTDEQIKSFDNLRWGCDFGLRDPTVLIGMQYEPSMHKLIIFDEIYKPDMTLDQMDVEFRAHHFGYEYIVADCAGATLITSLRARGLDIIPCKKGSDSIMAGVKWLQSLTAIEIDADRCPNAYREFINYEYEKNKMGEFTGRLPDKDNHAVDATRYGTEGLARSFSMF